MQKETTNNNTKAINVRGLTTRKFWPHQLEEDGGDTPGLAGTLSGSHAGLAALRREWWEHLESKHCQKSSYGGR
jgi:hypothetical protein